MSKTNPIEFLQEVRQETSKVTWPTRKETGVLRVAATATAEKNRANRALFKLLAKERRLAKSVDRTGRRCQGPQQDAAGRGASGAVI